MVSTAAIANSSASGRIVTFAVTTIMRCPRCQFLQCRLNQQICDQLYGVRFLNLVVKTGDRQTIRTKKIPFFLLENVANGPGQRLQITLETPLAFCDSPLHQDCYTVNLCCDLIFLLLAYEYICLHTLLEKERYNYQNLKPSLIHLLIVQFNYLANDAKSVTQSLTYGKKKNPNCN